MFSTKRVVPDEFEHAAFVAQGEIAWGVFLPNITAQQEVIPTFAAVTPCELDPEYIVG